MARTLPIVVLGLALGAGLAAWLLFAEGEPIARSPAVLTERNPSPKPTVAPLRAAPRRGASSATPESQAAAEHVAVRVVERESKTPVAGATVTLFDDDAPSREATTDASGVARVPGRLGEGGGRIRVRAAGFATQDAGASSDDVTVEMDRGVAADGIVLETDGRPIAGAHVVHRRVGEDEDCLAMGYPPLAEATTAADGTFRLEGLRADRAAEMSVSAPRHVTNSATWDPAAPGRVEIRLYRGGRITGVVLDPSRAPAGGASVGAYPVEAPEGTPILDGVTTDAAGRFEIDGVPLLGAWTLDAELDGFADADHGEVVVDAAHPEASCELLLRPLARIEVVVVDFANSPVEEGTVSYSADGEMAGRPLGPGGRCVLEVGRPGSCHIQVETPRHPFFETDATCTSGETTSLRVQLAEGVAIAGVVVDDLGHAVPQAEVRVQGHVGRSGQWFARSATSGDDGTFRVAGLAEQEHAVQASAPGHETVVVPLHFAESADTNRIVLRRNGHVTLRLRVPEASPPPESWGVVVVERVDKNKRCDSEVGDWTDGSVSKSLAPGRWIAVVQVDGFVHEGYPVEVTPGGESSLGEILLQRGGLLQGTVRDPAGKAVSGFHVVLSPVGDTSGEASWVASHLDGSFEDRRVAGRYRVVVTRGETTLATREVDLRDGEETNVEIVVGE
jgi:hypothetical protein